MKRQEIESLIDLLVVARFSADQAKRSVSHALGVLQEAEQKTEDASRAVETALRAASKALEEG